MAMHDRDKSFLCGVLGGVGAGVLLANVLALHGLGLGMAIHNYDTVPRLIGQGCEASGGDLWAMEESDFPTPCQRIEAWPPSG